MRRPFIGGGSISRPKGKDDRRDSAAKGKDARRDSTPKGKDTRRDALAKGKDRYIGRPLKWVTLITP